MFDSPLNTIKRVVSAGLLVFSIVVISVTIFDEQTRLSEELGSAVAFVAMWLALVWLARVEGGQACMVGLPPVDPSLYKESHRISHQVCAIGHKGDNLERYLMGRQFMVLVLVFVINMAASPVEDAKERRTVIGQFFMEFGLALILLTAMVGQLFTQVTASYCMLDYMNSHFMTFTVYVALAIEASGILHASYLVQYAVAFLSGRPVETNEAPRNLTQNIFFWGRVLLSCGLLTMAFAVTMSALFEGKTTIWGGLPSTAGVILFFVLMSIVGMLEGMQIAFFAVTKLTEEERNQNRWSHWVCDILFGSDGRGLAGFMIGRQLCVASCFFGIARITTISLDEGEDNVLGVSDGVQSFFETGLLGAIITTTVGSLAWQLIASAFPIAFLGNPVTYTLLRICLILESTGICAFSWVLSELQQEFMDFHEDEYYIGTAEQRAAKGKADKSKAGLLTANKILPSREKKKYEGISTEDLLEHIESLKAQVDKAKTKEEREAMERELTVMEMVLREQKQKQTEGVGKGGDQV